MQSLQVATIRCSSGIEVGKVVVTANQDKYGLDILIAIQGDDGQKIAELLNRSRIIFAPTIPGQIWVEPAKCPEHTRSIDLPPLVAAMSSGKLTTQYHETTMEKARHLQLELAVKKSRAGKETYISIDEVLNNLTSMPEPNISSVERLMHEYQAGPDPTKDWLARFTEAFAAPE